MHTTLIYGFNRHIDIRSKSTIYHASVTQKYGNLTLNVCVKCLNGCCMSIKQLVIYWDYC